MIDVSAKRKVPFNVLDSALIDTFYREPELVQARRSDPLHPKRKHKYTEPLGPRSLVNYTNKYVVLFRQGL